MQISQMLVPESKYALKSPYAMVPEGITVHNTANDASAKNEASYMISNNLEASWHYAVDDLGAVQCLPLNRAGWHAGDGGSGFGNRKTIGIEICYSKSGGTRFEQAERNAAVMIAQLMHQFNWTKADLGTKIIAPHRTRSGKYCPHRTLDMGLERFWQMVRDCYDGIAPAAPAPAAPAPAPPAGKNHISYQVSTLASAAYLPKVTDLSDYAGIIGRMIDKLLIQKPTTGDVYCRVKAGGKWYPEVKNATDFAGVENKAITDVAIRVTSGTVRFRVHCNGKWYEWITAYNINDPIKGYAGIGKPIDGIQIEIV